MSAIETPLDHAHQQMVDAPDDADARLRFYERLAEGELYMMLADAPDSVAVAPRIFPLDDGDYVLVFDREDRLARFAGGATSYAALPGRRVAAQLHGRRIGLALNLGEAPSEILLPHQAVDWLAETLAQKPATAQALPQEIASPRGLPDSVLRALDAKLARMTGLAHAAYLAAVTYATGAQAHLLVVVGAVDGAEAPLSEAIGEALTFAGSDSGWIDITFLPTRHTLVDRLERVALRFDVPRPVSPERPKAPGLDPDAPPRLR